MESILVTGNAAMVNVHRAIVCAGKRLLVASINALPCAITDRAILATKRPPLNADAPERLWRFLVVVRRKLALQSADYRVAYIPNVTIRIPTTVTTGIVHPASRCVR